MKNCMCCDSGATETSLQARKLTANCCVALLIGNFEIRTILQLAASIKDKIKKLHVLCTG